MVAAFLDEVTRRKQAGDHSVDFASVLGMPFLARHVWPKNHEHGCACIEGRPERLKTATVSIKYVRCGQFVRTHACEILSSMRVSI